MDLGSANTVTYSGDTTGLPNWVASTRLEWTDAPDDTLLFTAPAAGQYAFTFSSTATTNGGMGASARDMANNYWFSCPATASGMMIDGVFETPAAPATLTAGQKVLIYVSAAYWSVPVKAGPYTLTITKQ